MKMAHYLLLMLWHDDDNYHLLFDDDYRAMRIFLHYLYCWCDYRSFDFFLRHLASFMYFLSSPATYEYSCSHHSYQQPPLFRRASCFIEASRCQLAFHFRWSLLCLCYSIRWILLRSAHKHCYVTLLRHIYYRHLWLLLAVGCILERLGHLAARRHTYELYLLPLQHFYIYIL